MASRHDHLEYFIHPTTRLLWGLGCMVLFFLQGSWVVLVADLLVFGVLGHLSGKKISLLYFIFFIGSIAVFSLLAPQGQVFASLGLWDLTWGALEIGMVRGLSLAGMIFISLFSISPKLQLPGSLGSLMSRVFYYFHNLLREKKSLRPDHLWEDVDSLLDRVFSDKPGKLPPSVRSTTPLSWFLMILLWIYLLAGLWFGKFLTLLGESLLSSLINTGRSP